MRPPSAPRQQQAKGFVLGQEGMSASSSSRKRIAPSPKARAWLGCGGKKGQVRGRVGESVVTLDHGLARESVQCSFFKSTGAPGIQLRLRGRRTDTRRVRSAAPTSRAGRIWPLAKVGGQLRTLANGASGIGGSRLSRAFDRLQQHGMARHKFIEIGRWLPRYISCRDKASIGPQAQSPRAGREPKGNRGWASGQFAQRRRSPGVQRLVRVSSRLREPR